MTATTMAVIGDGVRLNLSHCHFPTQGLGPGRRVGIWFQGCSIHCPGCIVPETWEASARHDVSLADLLASLQPWLEQADGVTISGGEPFDQPRALLALVSAVRVLCSGDVLVYSGHPWKTIAAEHTAILPLVDVVISEPFVAARHAGLPLIGSANQRVHLLTPMAEERFCHWQEAERGVGVCEREGVIYMTGILRPGELKEIARDLSRRRWDVRLTHEPI